MQAASIGNAYNAFQSMPPLDKAGGSVSVIWSLGPCVDVDVGALEIQAILSLRKCINKVLKAISAAWMGVC